MRFAAAKETGFRKLSIAKETGFKKVSIGKEIGPRKIPPESRSELLIRQKPSPRRDCRKIIVTAKNWRKGSAIQNRKLPERLRI
jgi:hypothetical protein